VLFSDDIAGNARIMYHRDSMERAPTAPKTWKRWS